MSHQDKRTELSVRSEKAVLVGVLLPDSSADPRDPLGELASLAKTAGAPPSSRASSSTANIATPAPTSARAKALEIKALVKEHDSWTWSFF